MGSVTEQELRSGLGLYGVWTGATGQFRIADKPRAAVPGSVELGNNADAAIVRVGDELANFFLRVKPPLGAHPGELGKLLALGAESLIIGKMRVQDVQFYRGHAIEIALEHVDGNEVAAHVDQRAAPGETRLVFDGDGGHGESVGSDLHELQKSLQAADEAEGRRRIQLRGRVGDGE